LIEYFGWVRVREIAFRRKMKIESFGLGHFFIKEIVIRFNKVSSDII